MLAGVSRRTIGAGVMALAVAFAPGSALAGAWTLEAGTGQAIVSYYYLDSDKGFDGGGSSRDIPDYTKSEAYLSIEYGLTDELTLLANPSLRHVTVEGSDLYSGLGYGEIGARYRVFQSGSWVGSLQAVARIPGQTDDRAPAQIGSTDPEYDLRALAGYGFTIGGNNAFVDLQGAYRIRAGDPPDEARVDVTVGYRPFERFQVLAQSFNTVSVGGGEGFFGDDYRYHDVSLSGVYDLTESVSFQLGGRGTVAGENALRERGVFTALWYRF